MTSGQAKYIVLLAIISITSGTKPSIKANYAPRIINGKDTTIEKWPFLAQLIYKNGFWCGTSVLTSRWVITAAHCLKSTDPAHYKIYTDSTISKHGTIYDVETIKLHENYDLDNGVVSDVALVQVKREFRFSSTLQTIKADFAERQSDTEYKNCSVAGWGNTARKGGLTPDLNLQMLDVDAYTLADCKDPFYRIRRTNVCVRSPTLPAATCFGDSGGPLVCDGVLVGVFSYGNKDCNSYSVYTKVASFYTWANAYMKKIEKKFGNSQG